MNWLEDSRYISFRKEVIKKLKVVLINETTVRRVERQIYNLATRESRIASWENNKYVKNYNKICDLFIQEFSKLEDKQQFDNKIITVQTITELIGKVNFEFILETYTNINISYFRKNIIRCILSKITKYNLLKNCSNNETINIAVAIEKSCFNEATKQSKKYIYSNIQNDNSFDDIYNFITNRIITYIDGGSDSYSEYVMTNLYKEELYNKIGSATPEDIFIEKFQDITDEINMRQNITIVGKISTEYMCRVCHARKVIIKGIQTRSLDEGETLYAECTECKNKWRVS